MQSLAGAGVWSCPGHGTVGEKPSGCGLPQGRIGGVRLPSEMKGASLTHSKEQAVEERKAHRSLVSVRAAQTASRGADLVGSYSEPVLEAPRADVVELKGKVVLSRKNHGILVDIPALLWDNYAELFQGQRIELRLVSVDLDPETNGLKLSPPTTVEGWTVRELFLSGDTEFDVTFKVPADFGEPGAFLVRNNHPREFLMVSLAIEKPDRSLIKFRANSWVYNTSKYTSDRVFFSNKTYLPKDTPPALRALREQELRTLQGDGTGERRHWERVYDFDVYNDLGNPGWTFNGKRPTLGGPERPYPRRMRTGRAPSLFDPKAERVLNMFTGDFIGFKAGPDPLGNLYIPRDERYDRTKYTAVLLGSVWGMVHGIVPVVRSLFSGKPNEYQSLAEVRAIYEDKIEDGGKSWFKYPLPQVAAADDMACLDDEEFARQAVAGFSPMVVERVTEYPPRGRTGLTNEHIEPYLEGLSVEEAIASKRLFKVDSHDLYYPFIERINEQKGRKGYAPRTILFLNGEGKLTPAAIELDSGKAIQVLTPPRAKDGEANSKAAKDWRWELAKLHASQMDFAYHELVTHWLQTHASVEPFIIASHRQLSALHPIKTLLQPHLINTLSANMSGRQILVSAGGYIELFFVTGPVTMEVSQAAYPGWRFDQQALPEDLIARGMAERTPDGGLRLVLEDYPYAKDGLEHWAALQAWVERVVALAYSTDEQVVADEEVQAWYRDIRERGHGDHKDQPWWPRVDGRQGLVRVLTIILWITSSRHAAVHYGQFPYAGYVLNRPGFLRRLIPEPGTPEDAELQADPEKFLLSTLASRFKNFAVITGAETLSIHPTNEEYIGTRNQDNWTSDPELLEAFRLWGEDLKQIERNIQERNADPSLHHRNGPARMPYSLLYPSSGPGITGRGVPYSLCA